MNEKALIESARLYTDKTRRSSKKKDAKSPKDHNPTANILYQPLRVCINAISLTPGTAGTDELTV